jgi:hypothetical protein
MPRLKLFLPELQKVYAGITIVLPPPVERVLYEEFHQLPGLQVIDSPGWAGAGTLH